MYAARAPMDLPATRHSSSSLGGVVTNYPPHLHSPADSWAWREEISKFT